MAYWMVFLGGGIGSILRFWVSGWIYSILGPTFPWGTLVVNLLGSFAIGVSSELFYSLFSISSEMRMGFLIGILGGFTTFSSFAFESVSLLRDGEIIYAVGNVLLNNVLAILLCFLGLVFAKGLVFWIRG